MAFAEEIRQILNENLGIVQPTSPREPEIAPESPRNSVLAARAERAKIERRNLLEAAVETEEQAEFGKPVARGALNVLVQTPAFLLDLIESIPNFAGGSAPVPAESLGGIVSRGGRALETQLGLEDPRPLQDRPISERLVEFGTEAAGAAVLPFAAARKVGQKLKPLVEGARPGFLARQGRSIAEEAAKRPGRLALAESAAAVGEAAGRVTAQERFPDSKTAEFLLGITGAITPGIGSEAAKFGFRRVQRIGDAALPSSERAVASARTDVAANLQEDALDRFRAAENIEASRRIADEIPGFDPSAAQRTREPGILEIERTRAAASRELRDELIARKSQTNEALLSEVRARAPLGDVEDARMLADSRRAQLDNELSADVAAATDSVQRRMDVATNGRPAELSSEDSMAMIAEESGRVFRNLSERLDAHDVVARESGETATREILDNAVTGLTRGRGQATKAGAALPDDLIDVWRRISHDVIQEGDETVFVPKNPTLFEVRDFEKELNRRIRSIEKSIDRSQNFKLPALYDLQDATRKTVQNFIETNHTSEIASGYRTLLDEYFATAKKYRRFISGESIARATNPMVEDATLGAYFARGVKGRKRMQAYLQTTEDLPEARKLMDNYIVGTAIDQTIGKDELINAGALERFKRSHRAALGVAPEAAAEIDNVLALQRTADDAIGRQKRSLKELQSSRLALFAKNPRGAMNRIVNAGSPTEMRREARLFMAEVQGDDDAVAGARRFFWDRLFEGTTDTEILPTQQLSEFLDPRKLHRKVNKFAPAIEEIFGREHRRNVELFIDAALIASGKGGAGDLLNVKQATLAEKLFKGASFRAVYSRFYSGRVRGIRIAANLSRVLRNQTAMQQSAILDETLANPGLMRAMLLADTPRNMEILATRIRGSLITLGHRIEEREEP